MAIRKAWLFAAVGAALFATSSAQAGYIAWPCSGSVTSPYGPRSSPCSGCSTFHYGIDIGVSSGTHLGAPAASTFVSWVWSSCGGNIYTLGYGNGWTTRFLHCSSAMDTSGSVGDNQDCAHSGNTGSCTTGAHLHFEVRKDGVAQSIPGNTGEWKTRNVNIPKDYPGMNDPASVTYTIDNASAGFSYVGSWALASSATDKYGADYRYKSTAPVSEPASFSASVTSGTYNIYAWWTAGTNRSTTAPYILPGDSSGTAANQQINGGKFNFLGSRSLGGTAVTKLSIWTTTGYVVIADAVRYIK